MFCQVLLGKTTCTEKVDIYSYGVVLWEICAGEAPSGRQLRPLRHLRHLRHSNRWKNGRMQEWKLGRWERERTGSSWLGTTFTSANARTERYRELKFTVPLE